ncbi:hypothetical protein MRX96_032616 [Rhipicephalus microplus]
MFWKAPFLGAEPRKCVALGQAQSSWWKCVLAKTRASGTTKFTAPFRKTLQKLLDSAEEMQPPERQGGTTGFWKVQFSVCAASPCLVSLGG